MQLQRVGCAGGTPQPPGVQHFHTHTLTRSEGQQPARTSLGDTGTVPALAPVLAVAWKRLQHAQPSTESSRAPAAPANGLAARGMSARMPADT